MTFNHVDTRHRFNVDTTSYDIARRRIDVETMSRKRNRLYQKESLPKEIACIKRNRFQKEPLLLI